MTERLPWMALRCWNVDADDGNQHDAGKSKLTADQNA